MSISAVEQDKYARMWAIEDYRAFSPGVEFLPMFLEMVGSQRGTLLDAGCGSGRAGEQLAAQGFTVTLMDLTDAGLEVAGLPFVQGALWERLGPPLPRRHDFGYCCDVLEHLPTQFTLLTVDRLIEQCERVFFTVATEPDVFGVRIGEPLHLTVQPFTWWRDAFREFADVIEARDCGQTAVFLLKAR